MGSVSFAHDAIVDSRPSDIEHGVIPPDAAGIGGLVELGYLVSDFGVVLERLKPMRKPARYIEHLSIGR